jgi:hypothetical protein
LIKTEEAEDHREAVDACREGLLGRHDGRVRVGRIRHRREGRGVQSWHRVFRRIDVE